MFQCILVLTDLTDTTRFAFEPVAALARKARCRVVLAHAVVGSTEQYFLDDVIRARIDERAMAKARPALEAIAAELHGHGVDVETALEIGSPFNVLFQIAERYDVDLIVVPTRHQHSVVRRVSNSVTARAIRAHAVPVMTMNEHFGAAVADAGWRGFAHVLHPVDFGKGQRDGLHAASHFARDVGAKLRLAHVVRPLAHEDLLDDTDAELAVEASIDRVVARAEVRLADELARLDGVLGESRVLVADSPGEGICAHARAIAADCIILPALGRDKVRTQLMGSVAEYVIAHAPCPVLFHDGRLGG